MDKSDKKIELMTTTIQTLIKSTIRENIEKYHSRGGEDDKM